MQDDEAELLAELERIKRERAEEAARKASGRCLLSNAYVAVGAVRTEQRMRGRRRECCVC